jgi:uncharacterized protein YcbK (DUF882 family)
MTIVQKQCLLKFLGHYRGSIDGLWGSQSQEAAEAFCRAENCGQEELEQALKRAVSAWQEEAWTDVRYFTPEEFACRCGRFCDGHPAEVDRQLLRAADRVRERLGVPCRVSSGLRCTKHNAAVGGVANSRHLTGKAMDFCAAGKTAGEVLAVAKSQPEIRYAYAIDGSYVHMDVE